MKKLIPQFIKNLYHLAKSVWANLIFGFPGKKIKVIGVTGTNGKTTTCQMIAKVLEKTGEKVALASTINFKIGSEEWVNDTKFTTLSAWKIQRFLARAKRKKCEYVVLEVSSHSLDQNRTWGIKFDTAVITNVTREHLDYHKTIEKYRKAKLKLFKQARVAVVNLDMENPEDFFVYNNQKKYGYTTEISNESLMIGEESYRVQVIFAGDLKLTNKDSVFRLGGEDYRINLPGKFNVENSLAAICVGLEYDLNHAEMIEAFGAIKSVPGRLENVENDLGINIIVDYAVTPDSLEKLYSYVSEIKGSGKVIAVFGSCGERDRGKRPIMGEIVDEAADFIILTNEDPYNEDPKRIVDEVSKGIKNKIREENFWIIMDRRAAISKALSLANPGDVLLVTGKGAEETMALGSKRIPWNDKKVIQEEIAKLRN